MIEGGIAGSVDLVDLSCAFFDQAAHAGNVAPARCNREKGAAIIIDPIPVCAMLDKNPAQLKITLPRRHVKRGPAIIIGYIHSGAVFYEKWGGV